MILIAEVDCMPSQKLKLLYLYRILYQRTDEQHCLTCPELGQLLSDEGICVERKAIYRDLDVLEEFGYPIRHGKEGYYLESREFGLGELRLLLSAVQAATFITPAQTEALCEKLQGMASCYQRESVLALPPIGGVKCDNQEVFDAIDQVSRAVAQRRRISFCYYKRDVRRRETLQRQGKRYEVSPYATIWMQDRYYLVCNMEGRDDLTHFRLDRMRDVRAEEGAWRSFREVSPYDRAFDVSDYAAKAVNMFGGKVEGVILSCDNSMSAEMYDRFGSLMKVLRMDEQRFTARVETVAGEGFLNWVAQFSDRVEIKGPARLRLQMRQRLQAALERYCREGGA